MRNRDSRCGKGFWHLLTEMALKKHCFFRLPREQTPPLSSWHRVFAQLSLCLQNPWPWTSAWPSFLVSCKNRWPYLPSVNKQMNQRLTWAFWCWFLLLEMLLIEGLGKVTPVSWVLVFLSGKRRLFFKLQIISKAPPLHLFITCSGYHTFWMNWVRNTVLCKAEEHNGQKNFRSAREHQKDREEPELNSLKDSPQRCLDWPTDHYKMHQNPSPDTDLQQNHSSYRSIHTHHLDQHNNPVR